MKVCKLCTQAGDVTTWRLKPGTDLNQKTNNLSLLAAAFMGHIECMKELVKEGADVNCSDYVFDKQCRYKLIHKRRESLKIVDGCTPLVYAVQNCQIESVKFLVQAGADVNLVKEKKTVLGAAAEMGDHQCLKLLLQLGADVNAIGIEPALMHAVRAGSTKCLNILLAAGAHVNVCFPVKGDFTTPLLEAIKFAPVKCLSTLIDAGADVNMGGENNLPLHCAVIHRKYEFAKRLMEAGTDVNSRSKDGRTPVLTAVEFGNQNFMDLLIEEGADVNIADDDGVTPLIYGVEHGYRFVRSLINAGADVNRLRDDSFCDSVHKSALFRATVACDIASVRLLLIAGVRINERDYMARNALEYGITRKQKIAKDLHLLLYAAGETLDGPTVPMNMAPMHVNIPQYFTELKENLNLKHLCREAIRETSGRSGFTSASVWKDSPTRASFYFD